MWWSVWLRKPANTSIIRLYSLRAGRGQRVPVGHVRVVPRQLRVGRDDAELLLPRERPSRGRRPSRRRTAPAYLSAHSFGHVVRRVRGAEAEVQVERLVGVDLLGVGDELDRLVDQVLASGGSPPPASRGGSTWWLS